MRYVAKVNETVIRQRPLIERMCYEVKQRTKFEMGLEGIENGKGVGRQEMGREWVGNERGWVENGKGWIENDKGMDRKWEEMDRK